MTTALPEAFPEPPGHTAGEYRSIAFESGASLEKYLGWVPLLEEPELKTIVQRRGPLRRCLISWRRASRRRKSTGWSGVCGSSTLRTDLVLHDFDDSGRDERIVGEPPVATHERGRAHPEQGHFRLQSGVRR